MSIMTIAWSDGAHWVGVVAALSTTLGPHAKAAAVARDWRALAAHTGFVGMKRRRAAWRAAATNMAAATTLVAKGLIAYLMARGAIAGSRFACEFTRGVMANPMVLRELVTPRAPATTAMSATAMPAFTNVVDAAGAACSADFLDARACATTASAAAVAAVAAILPMVST